MSSMWIRGLSLGLLITASAAALAQSTAPSPLAPSQPLPRIAVPSETEINYALADWRRLRQSSGYAFADYARFLIANPGWPSDSTLRGYAEKAMRPGEDPRTVVAFFQNNPPTSGNGWARLAESYATLGRSADAIAAVRQAWTSSDLSPYDEASLFGRFAQQLTTADHDNRVDALLFDKKVDDARRMLPWTSAAERPLFNARIAMQSKTPDADTYYSAVAAQVATDAGLAMDRARYLRDRGDEAGARWLFARPHQFAKPLNNTERLLDMMVLLAGGAQLDRQYQTAYDIARQVDDLFAPGADISTKSYAIRDDYTTLAWIGGVTAYERLNRPADAMVLFDKYARGGKSLQVATKGWYWAGRAAQMAHNYPEMNAHFEKAAATPELFYGQLALERLGRIVPVPAGTPQLLVTDAQRQAFNAKRLVVATKLLGRQGLYADQSLFVRALSEDLDNDADRILATDMATQIYRPDLAVWTARSARNGGTAFYYRAAFPIHPSNLPSGRLWSVVNGITRQESSYDKAIVSHAGARGMMQLMPGTAREQANKSGVGYDYGRLITDPSYNVLLGSAYFQRLLDQWGGSYPLAIAAYNAGSGNVRKWINAYGDPRGDVDIISWIEKIPFMETRGYVQRVLENTVVYDRLNPTLPGPQPVHISSYLGKSGRPG